METTPIKAPTMKQKIITPFSQAKNKKHRSTSQEKDYFRSGFLCVVAAVKKIKNKKIKK